MNADLEIVRYLDILFDRRQTLFTFFQWTSFSEPLCVAVPMARL